MPRTATTAKKEFGPGDVAFIDRGFGHYIKQIGDEETQILIAFNSPDYQEISLSTWLAANPAALLETNFGVDLATVETAGPPSEDRGSEAMIAAPSLRLARLTIPPWVRLAGPAFAVSIGYMDPGNWASDLAAGHYRYALLWAVLPASAIAVVLQMAVARVTLALRLDLATAIATRWPRLRRPFGVMFAAATMATDLAEFAGTALGLHLLFGLDIVASVGAGLLVTMLLLSLDRGRANSLGLAMIAAVGGLIAVFGGLLGALHPDWIAALHGSAVPTIPSGGALLIVVAIFGATVMPHNLLLHSSMIHERCKGLTEAERRSASTFFLRETGVALALATLVNASIVVVGASLPGGDGTIGGSFAALGPVAGNTISMLFGAGLIASSIAATTTATLSGDYVVAAFSSRRVPPIARRADDPPRGGPLAHARRCYNAAAVVANRVVRNLAGCAPTIDRARSQAALETGARGLHRGKRRLRRSGPRTARTSLVTAKCAQTSFARTSYTKRCDVRCERRHTKPARFVRRLLLRRAHHWNMVYAIAFLATALIIFWAFAATAEIE